MRVLHVITGLNAGGAEHQLRLLAGRLPVECEVVTLSNPGAVAHAIRASGTEVHELTMASNRDITVIPPLVRLIRRGGLVSREDLARIDAEDIRQSRVFTMQNAK